MATSLLLGTLSIYHILPKVSYWRDFGFQYGGPVVYGFMSWLHQKLQEDKIQDVLFVARDGYTLQKVFNLIQSKDVRTYYFYAPRMINLAGHLNYDLIFQRDEKFGLRSLRALLSYFKLKNKFLAQITPEIKTGSEGYQFIQKHQKLFERLAAQERRAYQDYMKTFGIHHQKVALVDSGTMMFSAQKALSIGLPQKSIHGYYWKVYKDCDKAFNEKEFSSFLEKREKEFLEWNIMELFMSAPMPPADRIEKGQVVFKPVNRFEQKRIEIYPDLSAGMEDYTRFVQKIFGPYAPKFDADTLLDWINILCKIGTKKDRREFKWIQHSGDIDHKHYFPMMRWWWEKELKLFGFPLIRLRYRNNKVRLQLFLCLTLFKIEYQDKGKKLSICGLPICWFGVK